MSEMSGYSTVNVAVSCSFKSYNVVDELSDHLCGCVCVCVCVYVCVCAQAQTHTHTHTHTHIHKGHFCQLTINASRKVFDEDCQIDPPSPPGEGKGHPFLKDMSLRRNTYLGAPSLIPLETKTLSHNYV